MPLINCEINLTFHWCAICVIVSTAVPIAGYNISKTLCSSCDFINSRQCKTIKSFKGTINSNKYELKTSIQAQNQYLD